MVQSLNNQGNQLGLISRVGLTQNGRVIYKVSDPVGNDAGMVTVAVKDCDTFEKSYNDIIEAAPKMQKAADEFSDPEKVKKMQSKAKWITGISAGVGFLAPMPLTKKMNFKGSFFVQLLISLAGAAAGLIGGMNLAQLITIPSGVRQFNKATNAMSKIDVQPYTANA